MSSQIKGLSQFIADLRASNTAEAERARVQTELVSLRKKLAQAKGGKDLGSKARNGYEHRKVVSKLLYIYILGYEVDIGTEEALTLVQMPKFAEKQVGYLALGLLQSTRSDLREQAEQVVLQDLRSPKETLTSLALNYLTTWDPTAPVSSTLMDLVYQLLVSPTSSGAVVKKAALTYLHFFRGQSPLFTRDWPEWQDRVERISAILAGPNLGVATSVVSLLTQIAKTCSEVFGEHSINVFAHKLSDVFEETPDDSVDYTYYDLSAPWLVAKLCILLQYLASQFPDERQELRQTVAPILLYCVEDLEMENTGEKSPTTHKAQHRNARNFVFFDAVRLANSLGLAEWDPDLAAEVLSQLKQFLAEKDATLRYLALTALQSFTAADAPSLHDDDLVRAVLGLVKDRDISIRRQAIDALYVLVDSRSVETVAAELLDILVASDLQIRSQMVARLAALAERFATSHEWYFDTCLSLLMIGGVHAGDEIYQRLIQVVVNNQALHSYAVRRVYETLNEHRPRHRGGMSTAAYSDGIVRVAAFVLGEFAMLYKGDPFDLFVALQDRINAVPWATKVVMLTAYTKLAARFPVLRGPVAETLTVYSNAPNLETQQRANEYLRLLRPENADLLAKLLEPMPPFGEHTSRELFAQMHLQAKTATSPTGNPLTTNTTGAPLSANMMGLPPNLTQPELVPTEAGTARIVSGTPLVPTVTGMPRSASGNIAPTLSSNWEYGFKRMLTHPEAVLYQDALMQIGCRYEFRGSHGTINLYLKNVSSYPLTSLTVKIYNPISDDILTAKLEQSNHSGGSLLAGATIEEVVLCEAKQPFALTPMCRITFLAGTLTEICVKLPIVLERFMSPSSISSNEFQQRWEQLGPQLEFSKAFRNTSSSKGSKTVNDDEGMVRGMQYDIVSGSPLPTVFGAGIIHTTDGGMFGCLIVVQPDDVHSVYKVTVRATRKKIAAVVLANNLALAYQL